MCNSFFRSFLILPSASRGQDPPGSDPNGGQWKLVGAFCLKSRSLAPRNTHPKQAGRPTDLRSSLQVHAHGRYVFHRDRDGSKCGSTAIQIVQNFTTASLDKAKLRKFLVRIYLGRRPASVFSLSPRVGMPPLYVLSKNRTRSKSSKLPFVT